MPSDLSQIFGSMSVGIIAYAALLVVLYHVKPRKVSIVPWLIKSRYLPKATTGVALVSLLVFGVGLVIEDVTDHLTDSEYRDYFDSPLWLPHLQHSLLGSEGHHRVRTLIDDEDKLTGIGKQVFDSVALRQVSKTAFLASAKPESVPQRVAQADEFMQQPIAFLDGETPSSSALSADDRMVVAHKLISSMYYEAKNWSYIKGIASAELMGVQRRIDYCRSLFLVSTWFLFFALVLWLYQLWSRTPRKSTRWPPVSEVQSGQLLKAGLIALSLALLGLLGYGQSENNFNERVFGYYMTEHRAPAGLGEPDADWRLGATLWQQRSAEYAALCQGVYQSAADRLQARPPPDAAAIVMDLDETVLDNSGFQVEQILRGEEFRQDRWDDWEDFGGERVRLVPGAGPFIHLAQQRGYVVIFISNRREASRVATLDVLERLGVLGGQDSADKDAARAGSDSWLLLKGADSSKASRMERVSNDYGGIAMKFGDNLADFDDVFYVRNPPEGDVAEHITAMDDRAKLVVAPRSSLSADRLHWGVDWFVLPNPLYGDWTKLLPAEGRSRAIRE